MMLKLKTIIGLFKYLITVSIFILVFLFSSHYRAQIHVSEGSSIHITDSTEFNGKIENSIRIGCIIFNKNSKSEKNFTSNKKRKNNLFSIKHLATTKKPEKKHWVKSENEVLLKKGQSTPEIYFQLPTSLSSVIPSTATSKKLSYPVSNLVLNLLISDHHILDKIFFLNSNNLPLHSGLKYKIRPPPYNISLTV